MRAVLAALLSGAVLFTPVSADAAQTELDRAKARANGAARELADAQTEQAELEGRIVGLEAQVRATSDELTGLQGVIKERAVQHYIRGGTSGVMLDADLAATSRANALARFVSLGDDDAVDEYRRVSEDLGLARSALDAARREKAALVERLEQRVNAAFAELRKLERLEKERRARDAARARAASRRAAPTVRAGPAFFAGDGGWMCPVQGPRAFTNDWGDPRSGGRTHQGTDILAPRGTAIVANVGGTFRGRSGGIGGVAYYLQGDDGNTYYGAHLDSLNGASGRVAQGAVIGYVGNSGNASGGPTHLHFEIQPGGGRSVNPYPTLRQYC